MAKFRLLKQWVDHHVPTTALFTPTPCPIDVLVETHDPNYVSGFQSGSLDAKAIRARARVCGTDRVGWDSENLKKLIIPRSTTGDARETSAIELALNLPADSAVITKPFDPSDDTTYNLNTAVTIFDAGGNEYLATVFYQKTQKATPEDPTNKFQTFVYIGDTKLDEFLESKMKVQLMQVD